MAITVRPLPPPTIYVNGVAAPVKESQTGPRRFEGHRDSGLHSVMRITGPATITFSGPDYATIRYTFNSKKVNLGSKKYRADDPPVVLCGGNGFDGSVLTIRAKSFRSGTSSKTAEAVIHVISGQLGKQGDRLIGDVEESRSQTNK